MPIFKDLKGNRWRVQEATGLEGFIYSNSTKHSKFEWSFNIENYPSDIKSYQIIHDSLKRLCCMNKLGVQASP